MIPLPNLNCGCDLAQPCAGVSDTLIENFHKLAVLREGVKRVRGRDAKQTRFYGWEDQGWYLCTQVLQIVGGVHPHVSRDVFVLFCIDHTLHCCGSYFRLCTHNKWEKKRSKMREQYFSRGLQTCHGLLARSNRKSSFRLHSGRVAAHPTPSNPVFSFSRGFRNRGFLTRGFPTKI